ncbi:NAD(P)H-binding protein [Chryseolinea soli]|uniref:NAD-dependent dehydratase n=1 Tax=Chryseolinea soli TaxID=2321403 RepID=A0A385SSB0_9BACT|nr:NAD(P)H-binding protein [Chryseolinea soli]AYB32550.1 NAD-dependent dehydratase [Chryseolinea soli]
MKITVTGSLGNISRVLVEKLVARGHEVKVVSSNAERADDIRALHAIPLIGSVEDYAFVSKAFEGADAVYLMIPPNFRSTDLKQYIRTVGVQYAKAIHANGIKYVVNLSSIGAHDPDGLGPTGPNYFVEQKLNALTDVHVLHLRPGMFLTNFLGVIGMVKHQSMLGNNFDASVTFPLSHPRDIAEVAFQALDTLSFSGKQFRYIVGDEKNGADVAKQLGNAVGKTDVRWVAFSDEQLLNALIQNGFSEQMATVYMVEIGIALRDGSFTEDLRKHKAHVAGQTSLQEFANEFAMVYRSN